ncbi:MAG TPA: zf-HC2 domain-containing protein [Thermoanaerobaculia bacterium]|jgi:hypothetical protein
MQEFAPTKSRLSGDCPSDEELAAYIDGVLDPDEEERIAGHLVSCERCFEIYSETVQLQREDEPVPQGEVVPFPSNRERWRPIVRYGLPIAAMLLVGIGVAYSQLKAPPELATAALAAPIPAPDSRDLAKQIWFGPRYRGSSETENDVKVDDTAFRLGVQLVNLEVSLRAKDMEGAGDVVASILGLLKSQLVSQDLSDAYTALRVGLADSSKKPEQFLPLASNLSQQSRELFASTPLDLGQWVEAGRLAAFAHDPSFFQQRETRTFLRRLLWRDRFHDLLRIDDPKLDPDTRKNLDRIGEIVSKGNLQASDYGELIKQLKEILKKYYPDE